MNNVPNSPFLSLALFTHRPLPQEVTEPSSAKSNPTGATIERVLRYSAMFGEVALATNSPYFSSTTARGEFRGGVSLLVMGVCKG